jgi:primase-polymerase (primpol)-like protein
MTMARPATIRVPDSLRELDQWVVWRFEQRESNKPTKVPYQVNGEVASSTDSRTWCSWDDALNALQNHPERWVGVGFVFSPEDAFFGVDLDRCLDQAGKLKPWALPIMERFSDTYAEISPSSQGIKIWERGRLLGGRVAFAQGERRPHSGCAGLTLKKQLENLFQQLSRLPDGTVDMELRHRAPVVERRCKELLW